MNREDKHFGHFEGKKYKLSLTILPQEQRSSLIFLSNYANIIVNIVNRRKKEASSELSMGSSTIRENIFLITCKIHRQTGKFNIIKIGVIVV